MGRLHVEVAKYQLNKHGEELCGDSVEVETCPDSTIVVLSDGLGSGVKANILSSLTTKMAVTMLKGGLKLDEVVEAFVHTLPVCERRQLAYSTFSILQIFSDGNVYLAEYDSPPAFIGRGSRLRSVRRSERIIDERKISEAFFSVEDGDWIVLTSDGVLHAGIGGIWNIGWGWDKVGDYISSAAVRTKLASELAEEIAEVTSKLYAFKPGDDATVVAIRVRYPRHLTMLVGPPVNPEDDCEVVHKLLTSPGKKVVCGGTTGNIVARILGRPIMVDLTRHDEGVPPIGHLEGIDLVSEGMLTLSYTLEKLESGIKLRDAAMKCDGASLLTSLLLEADCLHIIVGRAINPAHQSPDVPRNLALKHKIVQGLAQVLQDMGKTVTVECY
ncbi:MAG: SpoIIE family protein phosphatase [Firmicutes bacterium]|nr:SpoIIE family protein phosphatase [Bacillota bacterium]